MIHSLGFLAALAVVVSPSAADDTFFESKIRPVLARSCVRCHGPQKASGGLRLDSRDGLLRGGEHAPYWEDVASKAVAEVVRGVIEQKSDLLNQMKDFEDLMAVTRGKARQRARDHLRARYRHRPDGFNEGDHSGGSGPMSIGDEPTWPKSSVRSSLVTA